MEPLLNWLLWLCCCRWCCQQSETSEMKEEIESDIDMTDKERDVKQKYLKYQSQIETYKLKGKPLQEVIENIGYEIYDKKPLGSGGFGDVCKAMDLDSRQEIACKKICLNSRSKKVSKKELSDRVRQCQHEVWVIKLNHPNIIRIFKAFIILDTFYLMMELSIVGCVQNEMRRRKKAYSERIAKHYFADILSGLDYLHRNEIVHHDLKLDNFLIFTTSEDKDKSKNVIKICDFGISFVGIDREKGFCKKRANRGTIPYMAPEVLIKNMQLKHEQYEYIYKSTVKSCGYKVNNPFKTDIWSLGVCLFKLVCNRHPFKYKIGSSSREKCQYKTDLLIQQITDRYKWPKWMYNPNNIKKTEHLRHLRKLIRSLINKDANCRLDTKDIKNHDWLSDVVFTPDSE